MALTRAGSCVRVPATARRCEATRGSADERSSGPRSQLQRAEGTDEVRQVVSSLLGKPVVLVLDGLLDRCPRSPPPRSSLVPTDHREPFRGVIPVFFGQLPLNLLDGVESDGMDPIEAAFAHCGFDL